MSRWEGEGVYSSPLFCPALFWYVASAADTGLKYTSDARACDLHAHKARIRRARNLGARIRRARNLGTRSSFVDAIRVDSTMLVQLRVLSRWP